MSAKWEINQTQFTENIKQVIKDNPVIAVVKNNAYNYGLEFTLDCMTACGINYFSTTSLEEAIAIRNYNNTCSIFLMNPVMDFESLRRYNIEMTLPSTQFFEQYSDELYGIPLHMEFENLLHRSGFKSIAEMQETLVIIKAQYPDIDIKGLWTHFGYADEFKVTDYKTEKKDWLDVVNTLAPLHSFEVIHAQNSASYVREDGLLSQHTHLRLGIILYGSRPYSSLPETITRQSLRISSHVIQIRKINAGQSAGYSFAFTAQKDTRLAVVAIGYGDGILRTRAKHDCLINNRRYPIKALMMSHMFVEVDEHVQPDDIVYLYHEQMRIDEYTFLGVGANSEQLSALNHKTLILEVTQ
ncbi:alanine racemase [Macrococcus epidermidis]|uniref:alanine racemase n=1 Tax=Macrococcus epidermidis TaxID=1902580 RepID=UPI001EF2C97C|nr:alanine racemase [Macrococcus epidermidis]MCG7420404.1 alanine racemase [Macrococcus epidermidis]